MPVSREIFVGTTIARNGHLDVLRHAVESGIACVAPDRAESIGNIACIAAERGHLDMLKWARHDHLCTWDAHTCSVAAMHGQLKTLQYLRSENCPWNDHTLDLAAEYGHLDVVEWAFKNGCPRGGCFYWAAVGGQLEILKWLKTKGACPNNSFQIDDCKDGATIDGHWDVVRWLEMQDCVLTPDNHLDD